MKYSIYQIKDLEDCSYCFRSYKEDKFDFLDYEKVYSGSIDELPDSEDLDVLEDLFRVFNIAHPADFEGHSLSVSDIICLNKPEPIYYYCNDLGWKEIPLKNILK